MVNSLLPGKKLLLFSIIDFWWKLQPALITSKTVALIQIIVLRVRNFVTSLFAFIILTSAPALYAQPCVDNYFALTYTAPTDLQLSNSLLTRSDQLVCCGKLQTTAGQNGYSNGWLAKFTANGSVLWSKSYAFPEYTSTVFEDIAPAVRSVR